MRERLTVGSIFARTTTLALDDIAVATVSVALFTAAQTTIDAYLFLGTWPVNIAGVVVHYFLTRHIVLRNRLTSDGKTGDFWNMFGTNFLTGIGIILGCIALIVPGLYFAARWSLCSTIVIAEGKDATSAIDESWRLTKPHGWTILAVFALIWAPVLFGIFTLGIVSGLYEPAHLPIAIITNLLEFAPTVFGWYACVAIYAVLNAAPEERLSEVFA
jgi:4-amino-4-deoxy-L-arabinose transferase-like glycosyltransferase